MLSSLEMRQISRILHVQEKQLYAMYCSKRCGSSLRKRILKREDIKEQVVKYVGENARKAQRMYVWGYAATGALGIQSYLRPEKHQITITAQRRPARLRYVDIHRLQIRDFDCGYGFTAFCTKWRPNKLYGTGINTDSQIGYHEYPRKSGRILDYIIEPAKIEIPIEIPQTTKMKQVACGRAHTILLTDKEGVFSLGNNSYGQCGRPVVEGEIYRNMEVDGKEFDDIADCWSCYTKYNHNPAVHKIKNLPDNIEKVVCGQDHTLFLTSDGELYSCGLGADGQTGLETYNCVSRCSKINGDLNGERIVQVHSTVDCVLALSDRGDVFGWGNSEYNQLAMVTDSSQVHVPRHLKLPMCGNVKKVTAGGSVCALMNDKGEVFVWGFGILGKGPNLQSAVYPEKIPEALFGKNELEPDTVVTDIECGMSHFAALTDTKDLYTWGKNKKGCLGLGQSENRDQYFPLKVSIPAEVYAVKCGVDHMVALTKAYC